MADVLEQIADMIRSGFTSGFGPDWNLESEDEDKEDDEDGMSED
jgi:hypothetical protein